VEQREGFVAKQLEDCVRCGRWCHVLGAWDAPCCDRELRQWKLCVTFSASPRDSDARVGRTACWRRLVIVGEHGVARVEGTAFWRSLLSVSLPQR
jgi:hypothetical protein